MVLLGSLVMLLYGVLSPASPCSGPSLDCRKDALRLSQALLRIKHLETELAGMRGDSGNSRSAVVSTGAAPALTLEAAIAGLKPGAPPLCKRLLEGAFSKYTILHNLNAQWAQDWHAPKPRL